MSLCKQETEEPDTGAGLRPNTRAEFPPCAHHPESVHTSSDVGERRTSEVKQRRCPAPSGPLPVCPLTRNDTPPDCTVPSDPTSQRSKHHFRWRARDSEFYFLLCRVWNTTATLGVCSHEQGPNFNFSKKKPSQHCGAFTGTATPAVLEGSSSLKLSFAPLRCQNKSPSLNCAVKVKAHEPVQQAH